MPEPPLAAESLALSREEANKDPEYNFLATRARLLLETDEGEWAGGLQGGEKKAQKKHRVAFARENFLKIGFEACFFLCNPTTSSLPPKRVTA